MSTPFRRLPASISATLIALVGACLAAPATAQPQAESPLQQIRFEQHLGDQVPLGLPFQDQDGRVVTLGNVLGKRPALLVFAYYECPMLCSLVLNGVGTALKSMTFTPGREFDIVVVSIDPGETPVLASQARERALERYGRPETRNGWHFLTGSEESIRMLTRAAGFRYVYDKTRDEYGHAAGIVVLTPDGRIARYFFGIEYPPRDLRLGLIEAADRKIGSPIDQIFLYCFHYDPVMGKYSAVTLNILRVSAVATVLALGLLVFLLRRRELQGSKMLGTA